MPAEAGQAFSRLPGRGRILVAFSGGPDSVCLLHWLMESAPSRPVHCIHIDHRLDPASGERAERACALARVVGVSCEIVPVTVDSREGPESDARRARYAALEARLGEDETLLTAHHADDQVETVLLRLLRGSGPEGLAGIPALRRFGRGWLVRPLLEWRRSDIEQWLAHNGLDCLRDPANECQDFDRNHLRHRVVPALRERWPELPRSIARSASLCKGAAGLIGRIVERDLREARREDDSLDLGRLSDDSDFFRAEVIRHWFIQASLPPPPGRRLDAFIRQLDQAAGDRQPSLRWKGRVIRAWRGRLWMAADERPRSWELEWNGLSPLTLPGGLGRLALSGSAQEPMALTVRSGTPGERLRTAARAGSSPVKRLLAEAGVPPWQRPLWPRVWFGDRLVAVGDFWLDAEWSRLLQRQGRGLVWHGNQRRLASPGLESPS